MKNLFSVTKEKQVSRFSNATMILERDRGKNTTKRFLFDEHANEVLHLTEGAEIGVILADTMSDVFFIADLAQANKEELQLSKEDINVVNKTKIKFKEDEDYLYTMFNNRLLHERILEEFELNGTFNHTFRIEIAPDAEYLKPLRDYLGKLGITTFYQVLHTGRISETSKPEGYLKKRRAFSHATTIQELENQIYANKKPSWFAGNVDVAGVDPIEEDMNYQFEEEDLPHMSNGSTGTTSF